MIPREVIDRVKSQLDVVELVGRYVKLQRKGKRFWGCCPFHKERTPSFTVEPSKGGFYCFGCHEHGSGIDFLMQIEGIRFP